MLFVLDTDTGAVHVLVNGSSATGRAGNLRHFERAPGGGWTSTTLHARPLEFGAVIRRDDSDGALVVVFKDRYRTRSQILTRR